MALGWFRWRAWVGFGAVVAAAVCVAGVALRDIGLDFAWQAWHFVTSTFVLRGRCRTCGTGLAPTPSLTHQFVTHHLSHTPLSHTIFDTPLRHTPSFTHHFVTPPLSHTPSLSHTIFHTHNFVTHHFVTHHLSHTTLSYPLFHTQLSHTHTLSFTHNFATDHL